MINILYLHAGSEMYGADKVLLELVTNLDKKIFHPIVILPSTGRLSKAMKAANIEIYVIDYPILRRKYFNPKGILKYVKNYRMAVTKICKLVKNKKIRLIHINTIAVLEGIYLRKKLKVPLIWHIHEIIERPQIIFKITSFLVGRFSDKIVAVSEAVEEHLINSNLVPKKKIRVIYNGINNDLFHPGVGTGYLFQELDIPKDSMRVGMVGRVNAWKGQNDFVKAMSPLLGKHHNLYVILVGGVFDGEEWRMNQLVETVNNDANSNHFRILDFREDTSNMYNFFDAFVLPSTSPDPLPTVVLEAMACGKPIIGYKHGGIKEMVKNNENGLLAAPGNIDELGRFVDMLISNKELRDEFGANSLKRETKKFSMSAYIQNFSKLYMEFS